MKKSLIGLTFVALAACANATSFCISVADLCCDGAATSESYKTKADDSFNSYYLFYDTGSPNNEVNVVAFLDGKEIWQVLNLCGCGSTSVAFPTSGQHLVSISVQCKDCNGTCDAGSCILVYASLSLGEVLNVPSEYSDIQMAINSSNPGDTVLIQNGIYALTLQAPAHDLTIAGRYMVSNESADIDSCEIRPTDWIERCLYAGAIEVESRLVLIGLSFKGATFQGLIHGGGIDVQDRNLSILHCEFDSCYATTGGAVLSTNSRVQIENSFFRRVGAYSDGMACHLINCASSIDSTGFLNCFSVSSDADQNTLLITRGSLQLSNSLLSGTGWNTSPGAIGIRQTGIADSLVITGCTISSNRFHHFFRLPGEGNLQPSNIRFDSNTVTNNEFQHDLFESGGADTGSVTRFRYNTFTDNHRLSEDNWISRMLFSFAGRTQFCEISHNLFFNNEAHENSVAVLVETGPANLSFRDNYIFGNAAEGFANPPGGATMVIDVTPGAIERNMFISSQGYAVHHGISSSPPSYVLNCYWGDSTGPLQHLENPFGQGDSVHNRVSVTPWSVDSLFTRQA
ncbi:MAG: right-handed parallel beta-helix repeat-containing protein [bacterium]|nr:right-handed parallel beta-helix repeat-containing protein [bacterium]